MQPSGLDSTKVSRRDREDALSFEMTFSRNLAPLQSTVFAPLFFASIGFAIPFISLWNPNILRRGVLYALLMMIGKLAVGAPIILWTVAPNIPLYDRLRGVLRRPAPSAASTDPPDPDLIELGTRSPHPSQSDVAVRQIHSPTNPPGIVTRLKSSIIPAVFIGTAMVSRGEIGLLVAQIARGGDAGKGILTDEPFLVCIWAILLCTLIGPIGVGFVVRRWGDRLREGIWA